jgi:septum formation protein
MDHNHWCEKRLILTRIFPTTDIILASNSPRRQQFLTDIGLQYRVKTHDVDEVFPSDLKGAEIPNYLVQLKAKPFNTLEPNQLVITADTIVWSENSYLGKPKDKQEAQAMLHQLSGRVHQVITSVAFTQAHQQTLIHETSKVYFRALDAAEIDHYIDAYEPYDKAGGYGIQEWIGTVGIEKIEGSYSNIVGLPVAQVLTTLKKILLP